MWLVLYLVDSAMCRWLESVYLTNVKIYFIPCTFISLHIIIFTLTGLFIYNIQLSERKCEVIFQCPWFVNLKRITYFLSKLVPWICTVNVNAKYPASLYHTHTQSYYLILNSTLHCTSVCSNTLIVWNDCVFHLQCNIIMRESAHWRVFYNKYWY